MHHGFPAQRKSTNPTVYRHLRGHVPGAVPERLQGSAHPDDQHQHDQLLEEADPQDVLAVLLAHEWHRIAVLLVFAHLRRRLGAHGLMERSLECIRSFFEISS